MWIVEVFSQSAVSGYGFENQAIIEFIRKLSNHNYGRKSIIY
jgi:hypothetical protein